MLLLLLAPTILAAERTLPARAKKKLSAVSLLPDGSELQGVMFPRYDQERRLVGVLKARAMQLVNDQTISGQTISIEFFNPDQSPRGRVDLTQAVFDQSKGMIEAREPVTLQSDRINAKGNGLFYAFEQGEGFLLGPATTWIQTPIETTMKSPTSPLRAAAIGMSLIAQSPAAAPPPASASEQAALQADAAGKDAALTAAAKEARADLAAALDASNAANTAAKEFLQKADLLAADAAGNTPPPPQAKPLDVKPGPSDTVISCDGGMYFDPDQGVFVYLKNVRVTDPRFTMSGANELKVFLGKKPDTPGAKPAKDDKDKLGAAGNFSEVERIVATGAILINQKSVDGKQPIKASGAIFSYNVKADQVLVSGGYPWVVQGGIALRAKEPNLTLRIYPKAGKFDTEGAWDTILPLEQLQKKQP